ncbi:MAG: hypothetical protein RMM28_00285 [Thermoleophilia bacterium]|nr:hypothetical protein [Gaiellaceae bacterium]MDW8337562.1 hypothetical protein [Thermoleophilia bacterium]
MAAVLASPVAVDAVVGPSEAGVLARVHVPEISGAGPLGAVGRLTGRPRRPRALRPPQHLSPGRVTEAGR